MVSNCKSFYFIVIYLYLFDAVFLVHLSEIYVCREGV